jgi:DNA-binding NarL/FixJ family response regulator
MLNPPAPRVCDRDTLAFPMSDATWRRVATELGFSPQQTRIVALILCNRQDKEIAAELELTVPTVRTYLSRAFVRTGVSDRLGLVLRVFSAAQAES